MHDTHSDLTFFQRALGRNLNPVFLSKRLGVGPLMHPDMKTFLARGIQCFQTIFKNRVGKNMLMFGWVKIVSTQSENAKPSTPTLSWGVRGTYIDLCWVWDSGCLFYKQVSTQKGQTWIPFACCTNPFNSAKTKVIPWYLLPKVQTLQHCSCWFHLFGFKKLCKAGRQKQPQPNFAKAIFFFCHK